MNCWNASTRSSWDSGTWSCHDTGESARPETKQVPVIGRRRLVALPLLGLGIAACALSRGPAGSRHPAPPDPDGWIDAHALSAPSEARQTVASLAAFLTAPARNERDKARAIYRWVTAFIDYAPQGVTASTALDPTPEAVLARGTAVCAGFSDLFTALARAAGLEAESITGYGKGYAYEAGEPVPVPTNHAWNAVKIDGHWRLVDCTWGAGAVEDRSYVKRFNPFYFLTSPIAFSWLHFPVDPRWQLRDPPLTLAEFEALPLVRHPFFEYGLELVSHPSAIIRASTPRTTILIASPPGVALLASAHCPPSATMPVNIPVQTRRGRHSLAVDTRGASDCVVRVFATSESDQERASGRAVFRWALAYRVRAAGSAE